MELNMFSAVAIPVGAAAAAQSDVSPVHHGHGPYRSTYCRGVQGQTGERPAGRWGRIDMILTKSLSRFARNTVDCLEMVRMLKTNGIGVIFEKENINTLTESSEFLITLFSGFARAESESISKNVVWGIQKSRKSGKAPFQYKKLPGYRKGADGGLEIVPEEAETVKRIYRRCLDGCSLGEIKTELETDGVPTASGVQGWSCQVIHNILTNERYIGDALLQKTCATDCISRTVKKNLGDRTMIYVEDNHPAIIPEKVFYQAREEQRQPAQADERRRAGSGDRPDDLRRIPGQFAEYEDKTVRKMIDKVTVVDAETIRVRFCGMDMEVEKKLC